MFEALSVRELFDLEKTVAAKLFSGVNYPWEVLDKIGDFIAVLGPELERSGFRRAGENVWIAPDAKVAPSASIGGPCIIDSGAEIRHCAYIRSKAIVGKNAVVGNSVELKNCVLFDGVQVPHFNYVGDSVLGFKAHMGAGSVTSNVKSDKTNVCVKTPEGVIETGRRKLGAMLGDFVEVGCNSVLNPGTVLSRRVTVYPTSCVRGFVPENSIFKTGGVIAAKR
ncbi:MAG: UDP-N-acetylglucosamine pyrophosphorylase [Clostridia bacterium]|nr:UDP-N-acetylglucosamine pyrophosphorylase [Clostridia bacterium]